MKKLFLVIILFAIGNQLFAQNNETDSIPVYNLGAEIEVIDQRISTSFSKTARQVMTITREEIQHAPVESITELLEYIQGVDIRQRGTFGVQSDVSIRGGSANQSVVLLNGINITDPQTGHLTMNLPLSIDAIERIEVLQGPSAMINTPKPFAGAINIITNTETKTKLITKAMGGQHGLYDIGLTGAFPIGKSISNFMSVARTSSDGYINNTDFETTTAFYHGKYMGTNKMLNAQLGFSDKFYGANSFYTPAYPNQAEANQTYFASLQADFFTFIDVSPQIYWRRNTDKFELFRDGIDSPSWYSGHNYHRTDILGAAINSQKKWKLGLTSFGVDYRNESIISNNIGYDMPTPIKVPGEAGAEYTKDYSRDNVGLSLAHSYKVGEFYALIGLAGQWSTDNENKWAFSPGIDMGYNINDYIEIYGSANKSHRLPTFTERFYKSQTNAGNPNLVPEEALTYDAGIKLSYGLFHVKANYFYREGKNIIDWINNGEDAVWTATNITEINTQGISGSIALDNGKMQALFPIIQNLDVAYSYNIQDKNSDNFISKYALDYLKHKLDIMLAHRIYGDLSMNWKFSFQDRAGTYIKYTNATAGKETDYEPFAIVDARLNWKYKQTNIFIEASNLLNADYFDIGNVIQPKRWIRCGFKTKII